MEFGGFKIDWKRWDDEDSPQWLVQTGDGLILVDRDSSLDESSDRDRVLDLVRGFKVSKGSHRDVVHE